MLRFCIVQIEKLALTYLLADYDVHRLWILKNAINLKNLRTTSHHISFFPAQKSFDGEGLPV